MLAAWKKAVLSGPSNYVLLLGDQFEGTRTSFRAHIRGYSKDRNSQSSIDTLVEREVQDLADELEPIKDRIIGVLMGNHYYEFCSSITSDQLLCQKLGVPFLGCETGIRLDCKKSGKQRAILKIAAHHHGGSSGGKTFSGDANSLHKFEQAWDADCYLLGHTHKTLAFQTAHRTIADRGEPQDTTRRRLFVRCGCMRSMEHDKASSDEPYNPDYPIQQGLPPLPMNWPEIHVRLVQDNDSRMYVPKFKVVIEEP